MDGVDHLSHSLFWSMLVNIGGFIWGSLLSRPSELEQLQAGEFVRKLDTPHVFVGSPECFVPKAERAAVERLQACIADRDAETRGVLEKAKATETHSLRLKEALAAAEANAAAYTAKYHLLEASTSAGSARVRALEERMTGPRPASFLSFRGIIYR